MSGDPLETAIEERAPSRGIGRRGGEQVERMTLGRESLDEDAETAPDGRLERLAERCESAKVREPGLALDEPHGRPTRVRDDLERRDHRPRWCKEADSRG